MTSGDNRGSVNKMRERKKMTKFIIMKFYWKLFCHDDIYEYHMTWLTDAHTYIHTYSIIHKHTHAELFEELHIYEIPL
jgi:hypothetical protein